MLTPTGMCCLHMESSIPGHPFQSLSGFLACYDRRPGVSHIHQQSFDPSNLIIFVPVNKKKRKNCNQVEEESLRAADDCDEERREEDSGALGHPLR